MKVLNATSPTWNYARIEIRNYYDDNSFIEMLIATLCMMVFIFCGIWCICASCQLNKKDDNSYHTESEFEKDVEQPMKLKDGKI